MKGTDKQIDWAVDIRNEAGREIVAIIRGLESRTKTEQEREAVTAGKAAWEAIRTNDQASWWIDNRYDVCRMAREAIAKAAQAVMAQ